MLVRPAMHHFEASIAAPNAYGFVQIAFLNMNPEITLKNTELSIERSGGPNGILEFTRLINTQCNYREGRIKVWSTGRVNVVMV
jgi:hypothetical protein